MGIPRFFKLPKPKQFNYQPLYYDPVKEAKEERKKKIGRELGVIEGDSHSGRITRGSMREYFRRETKARRQSNIRLVIIIIVLFFVAYLLLFR